MNSFQQHILISMPYSKDPFFADAVIYLYQHNATHGAVGFVVNKVAHQLTLADIFEPEELPNDTKTIPPLLIGGPIEEKNIILLQRQKQKSGRLSQMEIIRGEHLKSLTPNMLSHDINAFLGCAGWQPGQLEDELKSNHWLVAPQNDELLYDIPIHHRYDAALKSIGVSRHKLSPQTGHA